MNMRYRSQIYFMPMDGLCNISYGICEKIQIHQRVQRYGTVLYRSSFETVLKSCPDLRELGLAPNWRTIQRCQSLRDGVCELDELACSMA